MANTNFSQTAAFIWAVADLLRGDFKQSQYGRVILPFTLLRRLECVLAGTKEAVLAEVEKLKASPLPEEGREKFVACDQRAVFLQYVADGSRQDGAERHQGQPRELRAVVL